MTYLDYFIPWPLLRLSILLLDSELMNSCRLLIPAGQSQASWAWGRP